MVADNPAQMDDREKVKENRQALYISYDGMTDPLGQSQVLPYLVGLAKEGFVITILSCEKLENYGSRREQIQAIMDKAGIAWEPLFYTKSPPVLSTVWDIRSLINRAFDLHKKKKFALVHCRSYIAALVGLKMQKQVGCKFIFDMRGFWADERVDGNLWNIKNPLYKAIYWYFKAKEVEFIERADFVISLTENARREIHSWKRIKRNPVPIQVIPCCVDIHLFSRNYISKSEEDLKRKLGIAPEDYVLTYLGAIGTWYMLDEMLDFYHRLYRQIPSSKFLFITAEDPADIFKKVRQKGIPEINIIVKRAERKEVPAYLALSNASIFFIKPAYSKKASSPTKQGELMSLGVPVICNTGVGDTDYVVSKYKSGLLVSSFDTKTYDNIISQFHLLEEFDAASIRRGAIKFFSLEEGIRRYSDVYADVLGKS